MKQVFSLLYDEVIPLKARRFGTEKQLQNLCQSHLDDFFGLTFLAEEFDVGNGRIDTLAINNRKQLVVIEYKLKASADIISQAIGYTKDIANKKLEIVELVRGHRGLKKISWQSIKWNDTRVMCVAREFSKHFLKADEYKNNPKVQLITYQLYQGLIVFKTINWPDKNQPRSRPAKTLTASLDHSNQAPKPAQLTRKLANLTRKKSSFVNQEGRRWQISRNCQAQLLEKADGRFVVLEGSLIAPKISPGISLWSSGKKREAQVRQLLHRGDLIPHGQYLKLKRDQEFGSANQAAVFATGSSVNVYTTLKAPDGRPMGDFR